MSPPLRSFLPLVLFFPTPQLRFGFLCLTLLLLGTQWLREGAGKVLGSDQETQPLTSPALAPKARHEEAPQLPATGVGWASYLKDYTDGREGGLGTGPKSSDCNEVR